MIDRVRNFEFAVIALYKQFRKVPIYISIGVLFIVGCVPALIAPPRVPSPTAAPPASKVGTATPTPTRIPTRKTLSTKTNAPAKTFTPTHVSTPEPTRPPDSPTPIPVTLTPSPTPSEIPVAVYQEILFYGFSNQDADFLISSLEWMRQASPDWWIYILTARPLSFRYNPASHYLATAGCCDANGAGQVTIFSDVFRWDNPNDPASFEVQRAKTLSALVHETTHIMDWRAGKGEGYAQEKDNAVCRALESAAYTKDVQALRDLANAGVGAKKIQNAYVGNVRKYASNREKALGDNVDFSCAGK